MYQLFFFSKMDYNGYTTEGNSVSHVVPSDLKWLHFNRIQSGESSIGQSSRVYYRNSEGVPFKWEMQPGKPKIINLPREEVIIPPPSPPPAVQSLWLPKPNCVDQPNKKWKRSISKLLLWKKFSKKNQQLLSKVERGDLADDFSSDIDEDSNYNQGRTASANKNDAVLLKGILSKNPSVNQSCRLYYRNPAGVPFEWEMFPGTSKNNPAVEEIIVPPPNPPPAVQGLGLRIPGVEVQPEAVSSRNSLLLFLKKSKTNQQSKKFQEISIHEFQTMEFHSSILSSSSSHILSLLSSRVWRNLVAKPSCYGAGMSKSIICAPRRM